MKKIFNLTLAAVIAVLATSCGSNEPTYANRAEKIVAEIHNPASKYVVVASHRGDWRNYPENSIEAIESVIRMGVDIMELDLKLTKDSVLVLCHDRTIDRTTTGKGKVCDLTYDEILKYDLKRAHGVAKPGIKMPTLREALEVCKDRICVNVDQGYEYCDLVLAITEELGVTDQILIKGKKMPEVVAAFEAQHENNMMYMPIIDIQKPKGIALFEAYKASGEVPLAYEICWQSNTPEVKECMDWVVASGSKLWVNSLWASLNGGIDDDLAYEQGAEKVYKQLLDMGASMIQTDRPAFLINYLRSIGRHD